MIAISEAFSPELRDIAYTDLLAAKEDYNIRIEEERKRFFLVLSFACNAKCKYCLFRLETIQNCSNAVLASKTTQILNTFYNTDFSISITGGEPLLSENRMIAVLNAITSARTPDTVRWIGIGTNGTLPRPTYLANYPNYPFVLYVSRHHYDEDEVSKGFGYPCRNLTTYTGIAENVDLRLSCNLIQGGIDCVQKIKRYLDFYRPLGIRQVTFRELNEIDGNASMYSDKYILSYLDFYRSSLVPFQSILRNVETDSDFAFISQDVRPFIYHERWQYGDMEVAFRRLDEAALLQYNDSFSGIDEVVLHPDGLITGCWDRTQKILDLKQIEGGKFDA